MQSTMNRTSEHRHRHPLFGRERGRSALRAALLALSLSLSLATVAAADDYAYAATHQTKKSADHVFSVLTAYQQVCDEGCKYYGPDVVKFIRVEEKRTETRWYTWTYVKTALKNTKYFNEVTLSQRPDDGFVMVTRVLAEKDQALVEFLTKKTGLEHNPVFSLGETTFTVTRSAGVTTVRQSMKMSATGMVTMFPKKIAEGMKKGAEATFQNIEK